MRLVRRCLKPGKDCKPNSAKMDEKCSRDCPYYAEEKSDDPKRARATSDRDTEMASGRKGRSGRDKRRKVADRDWD